MKTDTLGNSKGIMSQRIEFFVNGESRQVSTEADPPLLHVLRNMLGLMASRFGCGQERCGACMVLIDGEPSYACTVLISTCGGKNVMTAEILKAGAKPHPLHDAFIAEQAGQCGYCLSGILVSAKALLDREPNPTRTQIITALEPHLCRCGSHGRIITAVARAAASLRES
jgi:nicotinate dehydrogenase subunit A